MGPQTERSYARGHYRDLLASFSGSQLLTGRHGAAEVGYIDPTVLTGERNERLLLLAGRSWRVTDVDWSKRIVWLEPAAGGGKARWMGGARSLARDVCQGIRSVLADGPSPTVTLSRRAQAALQALTDEIPVPVGAHARLELVDHLSDLLPLGQGLGLVLGRGALCSQALLLGLAFATPDGILLPLLALGRYTWAELGYEAAGCGSGDEAAQVRKRRWN